MAKDLQATSYGLQAKNFNLGRWLLTGISGLLGQLIHMEKENISQMREVTEVEGKIGGRPAKIQYGFRIKKGL